MFVVSGRPPRLAEPLRVALNVRTRAFSITYSPWVSEETILRAYRATAEFFEKKVPREKTVRVLRFVSEQADPAGGLPPWPELLDRWNAAYPDERFSNRSGLHRAYHRAVEALEPAHPPPLIWVAESVGAATVQQPGRNT